MNTSSIVTSIHQNPCDRLDSLARGRVYESILDTVGGTPVVRIGKLAPAAVDIHVKLESFNPMGSVKDRLAIGVIEEAERSGRLRPGQTVIEATSGNTGIGLAMVCARKGYPLVIVMAENFSIERRRLMRFLGARVVLTPAARMGSGMLTKARELAEAHGWFLCSQFDNEANADIHSSTTAREIVEDFHGRRLDYWVSGYGTGGTLKGVARVLRNERPDTRIVVAEPENAPLLGSGTGNFDASGANGAYRRHPEFRPHPMQGWTPDFVSRLTSDAMGGGLVDEIVGVGGAEALRCARDLAHREGILTGISGGATFAAALRLADRAAAGSSILCMLPDTGERYLSTPLFEDIEAEMNEEEVSIARSTPACRFDAPAAAVAPTHPDRPSTDTASRAFVEDTVNSVQQPVVLFALQWCEFCWSVRKLFERLGVAYRSIDLDSREFRENDRGSRVRAALEERTGFTTIPQIFIGGEFLGGCGELFDAHESSRLDLLLRGVGIEAADIREFDARSLLPGWVRRR